MNTKLCTIVADIWFDSRLPGLFYQHRLIQEKQNVRFIVILYVLCKRRLDIHLHIKLALTRLYAKVNNSLFHSLTGIRLLDTILP